MNSLQPHAGQFRPSYIPEPLGPEQDALVSDMFRQSTEPLIDMIAASIGQTSVSKLPFIVQADGMSERSLAERQYYLNRLSDMFRIDVAGRIAVAKAAWLYRADKRVEVDPLMKRHLGVKNIGLPDEVTPVRGVRGDAVLHIDDNNRACWFSEVEFPHLLTGEVSTGPMTARVMKVDFHPIAHPTSRLR